MIQIALRPMTAEDFEKYRGEATRLYAEEKRKGESLSQDEAMEIARKSFQSLLPEGVRTPDQHLYTVLDGDSGSKVGIVWFGLKGRPENRMAFIYDIVLDPTERGKGYGKATMLAVEVEARKLGARRMALHVFGHNTVARKLYESLGYHVTNLNMAKEI